MEVSGSNGKKVILEVIDDHVAEERKYHDEIGLQRFDFNLFGKYKKGVVSEVLSEYPYLIMLMKLWPGDWKNQLERTNMKLDEENDKSAGMVNGQDRRVWRFSSN